MKEEREMNVIKRSGEEVNFDIEKIIEAIGRANKATVGTPLTQATIIKIADTVMDRCSNLKRSAHVEEIQDMVDS